MGRRTRVSGWLLGAGWLAACGGGGFTAPIDDKAPFEFSFADPADDTLPAPAGGDGENGVALDLVGVSGAVESGRIRLVLTFAAAVAPWSDAAPNSLDGFVDFDLDESAATGVPAAAAQAGVVPGLGAEYYLDLRDAQAGKVALVDARARTFRLVSARFEDATVTIDVPRGALDPDDGEFLLSLVVGTPTRPLSDVAPNASHYVAHRPTEPEP